MQVVALMCCHSTEKIPCPKSVTDQLFFNLKVSMHPTDFLNLITGCSVLCSESLGRNIKGKLFKFS